jgi:sugar isomerase, kpsF/gutQ family
MLKTNSKPKVAESPERFGNFFRALPRISRAVYNREVDFLVDLQSNGKGEQRMKRDVIREKAKETLALEAAAVKKLTENVDEEFCRAVECVLGCTARIVVTGMGKSGHVGRKIAATLASTGTPSFFMHPAEAFHGDLGMVTDKDVVLAISNSGEVQEVVKILPVIHRIGATIIAMTGNRSSQLAEYSDYVIDIGHEPEACPLGLAPTTSTTATLAMGDAIAVAAMSVRNFKKQDFALFHPGGALGRRLLLKVQDVMHTGEENPVVSGEKTAKDALFVMTEKGLGAVSVTDAAGRFIGLLTDGIIRRALAKDYAFLDEPVHEIMFTEPLTIHADELATAALSVMEKHEPRPVTVLPVIDEKGAPVGMIHLTDLLKQGVV